MQLVMPSKAITFPYKHQNKHAHKNILPAHAYYATVCAQIQRHRHLIMCIPSYQHPSKHKNTKNTHFAFHACTKSDQIDFFESDTNATQTRAQHARVHARTHTPAHKADPMPRNPSRTGGKRDSGSTRKGARPRLPGKCDSCSSNSNGSR